MPFDMGRMKKFFSTMLMAGVLITVVWGILSFATHMISSGNPMNYLGHPNFITLIVLLILEWTGYLMLHGKFQPPGDKGQQPKQMFKQAKQQQFPIHIKTDTCSFCGKEKSIAELREFKDVEGNAIMLCENCIEV